MAQAVKLTSAVPEGMPGPEHFEVTEVSMPELGDGILVELLTLSADPYMRGGLKMPLENGEARVMSGYVSGRVLDSAVDDWAPGDLFGASLPYMDVQAISAEQLKRLQIWWVALLPSHSARLRCSWP